MLLSIPQPINPYYEKQKKAFEMLLYTKFTDKNNAPLALKREAGKREEDQAFFRQNHSEKEFINYILNIDNQIHKAIYKSYGGGSGEVGGNGQGGAIKSYQVAMQYLGDIQKGAFDSDTNSNKPNPKKHREAIRALDNIGKNNIRGLYVGINEKEDSANSETKKRSQEEQKSVQTKAQRPKLIGRLATTIIMKDGLWIG